MISFVIFVSLFVGLSKSAAPFMKHAEEAEEHSDIIVLPRETDLSAFSPYRVESIILFEDGTSVSSSVFVSFDNRIETAVAPLFHGGMGDSRMTRSFNFMSSTGSSVSVPISIALPGVDHQTFWSDPEIYVSFAKNSNVTQYIHSLALTPIAVVLNPESPRPESAFIPISVPDSNSYMVQCNVQIITRDGRPTKSSRAQITGRQHIAEINPTIRITSLPSAIWNEILEELGSFGELRRDTRSAIKLYTSQRLPDGLLRLEFGLNSAHDEVYSLGIDASGFLRLLSEESGKIIYGLNIRENRESDNIVIGYDVLQQQSIRFDTRTGQVAAGSSWLPGQFTNGSIL